MTKDLRSFMQLLHNRSPDLIADIENVVDPKEEVTAIIGKLEKSRGMDSPLLHFKKLKGSTIPMVTNVYSGYRKMSVAMNADPVNLLKDYLNRKAHPIRPREVSNAPCKEVVMKGDQVDVTKFPIVTTSPNDDAPYFTTAVTIAKDPDSPQFPNFNLGIYRHRLISKNRIGLYYSWGKFIHYLHKKFEDKGKPMEVALAIGLHPCITTASMDQGHLHEYELAGALMEEPVELVKCETVDLHVPAQSEIVIEGKLLPGVRQKEGPFGEYPAYYGQIVDAPQIDITCVTTRNNPIYQHASSGKHGENVFMLGMEADFLATIKKYYPTVEKVHMPMHIAPYICIISMKKMNEGDAIGAGSILAGLSGFIKYAIVVDNDVNIYDIGDVLLAMTTRARADEDFVVLPRSRGNRLDPTTYTRLKNNRDGMVTKVIIDATTKTELPYQLPPFISEPMIDKINLADYGLKP